MFLFLAIALVGRSHGAWAHAFGQRYDLPVPLWLYLLGGAAAVGGTFILLATLRGGPDVASRSLAKGQAPQLASGAIPPLILVPCQVLAVAVAALVVVAGLIGHQSPFKNIAPVAVWVVWWVGLAYVCAFAGNVWTLINPWASVYGWAEAGWRLVRHTDPSLRLPYPAQLGVWPAALLFLLFAWAELVWPDRDVPHNIAMVTLAYSLVTWTGCWLFGRETWLRSGEAFSVAFDLIGRFAPVKFDGSGVRWSWRLRPYAIGLLPQYPVAPSLLVFVLLMLSTVTTDGLFETPLWSRIVAWCIGPDPSAYGGSWRLMGLATAALCVAPVLFIVAFLGIATLMRRAAYRSRHMDGLTTAGVARWFVLSLVPIGIAYHLAHYLSYLLLAGQFAIPLASDPFGFGWDLLGTRLYRIDIGIIDARTTWYAAVGAIVAGHIIAVWLAHRTALRVFSDRRAARRSQYPMMGLMIGYTVLSLWILAQPITEQRMSN